MKYLSFFLLAYTGTFFSAAAFSGETSGHGPLGPVVKCESMKGEIKYIPVTYCKMFEGKSH